MRCVLKNLHWGCSIEKPLNKDRNKSKTRTVIRVKSGKTSVVGGLDKDNDGEDREKKRWIQELLRGIIIHST